MNKKIILPFVAILVLAVAMVGTASADEVTTVDTVEIRGTVHNESTSPIQSWNATNFAAFWYDIDEDLRSETLVIEDMTNRVINDSGLVYTTIPQEQEYEICAKYDGVNDTKGAVEIEDDDSYMIEGWMAEEYVAVNGKADVLSKLLVEFEGDDKKTLATGEAWDLGSGFTLTAQQIDLEGDKVWFSLDKDGNELDSEVIDSSSGASHQQRTYTYTEDVGSEDDVPIFHCYVDAVFRGTDSNIVQVTYVFLIDNDVLEIDSDDTFGIMEVIGTSGSIVLKNEDELELDYDSTEHIMGDMYFRVADNSEEAVLRFYPFVEKTEPGEYEIRGTVHNESTSPIQSWDATNFAAFWYDIDEDLRSETLVIEDMTNRVINDSGLVYTTIPQEQEYEICAKYDGVNDTKGAVEIEDDDSYMIEGWMAEEYVAVNGKADVLSKLLVEFEGDDKKTLATGEAWDLGSGFTLTAQQIDLEGDKVWFSLDKDGNELDSEVIDSSSGASHQQRTYTYTEDVGSEDDVPIFHCYVDAVFRGTDSNIVQVTYVFLIDNDVLEIDSDDTFGIMEVIGTSGSIVLKNEDELELDYDSTEHIMGDMYFRVADNSEEAVLRFYPFVEKTIGEGAAADDDEVETPIEVNETAEANVTATAEVTPTPEPTATVEETVTDAEDTTTDAEPAATEKKTPGFEAIFAIAGLLAVAYLVLRQRE